jgi:hypothetical protein
MDAFDTGLGEERNEYMKHDLGQTLNNIRDITADVCDVFVGNSTDHLYKLQGQGRQFDMIFNDGDHRQEIVLREFDLMFKITKLILSHDIGLPPVNKGVNAFLSISGAEFIDLHSQNGLFKVIIK